MKDLSSIFEPRSVAIVGASANPVKWGCILPSNILTNRFDGGINLINPKGEGILGMEMYRNNVAKIIELMKKYEKPVIPVTTVADQRAIQRFSEEEIVIYSSLESTANILAKMFGRYKYLEW